MSSKGKRVNAGSHYCTAKPSARTIMFKIAGQGALALRQLYLASSFQYLLKENKTTIFKNIQVFVISRNIIPGRIFEKKF